MKALFRLLILGIYLFLMAPLIFVIISSVGSAALLAFPPRELTLRWYRQISPELLNSLWVSLEAATATTVICTILGVWIALAIARGRGPAPRLLRAVSAAPLSVPHLAIGIALYQAAQLSWDFSGLEIVGTFWGLMFGHCVIAMPFVVRGTLVGHAHVEAQIEEAAVSLGASPWRALFEVALPAIRPGLVSGAFLAFLASFDDVPVALFMGGGEHSTTFPLQVLSSLEYSLKPDIMAISTLVILASVALVLALEHVFGLEHFLRGHPPG